MLYLRGSLPCLSQTDLGLNPSVFTLMDCVTKNKFLKFLRLDFILKSKGSNNSLMGTAVGNK